MKRSMQSTWNLPAYGMGIEKVANRQGMSRWRRFSQLDVNTARNEAALPIPTDESVTPSLPTGKAGPTGLTS